MRALSIATPCNPRASIKRADGEHPLGVAANLSAAPRNTNGRNGRALSLRALHSPRAGRSFFVRSSLTWLMTLFLNQRDPSTPVNSVESH